jgi:hypothetical protein
MDKQEDVGQLRQDLQHLLDQYAKDTTTVMASEEFEKDND